MMKINPSICLNIVYSKNDNAILSNHEIDLPNIDLEKHDSSNALANIADNIKHIKEKYNVNNKFNNFCINVSNFCEDITLNSKVIYSDSINSEIALSINCKMTSVNYDDISEMITAIEIAVLLAIINS